MSKTKNEASKVPNLKNKLEKLQHSLDNNNKVCSMEITELQTKFKNLKSSLTIAEKKVQTKNVILLNM